MNKKITVKWVKPAKGYDFGYEYEMRVIESKHPRFDVGSRFDFGFLQIANKEGYDVEILGFEKPL